jgi:hypothetical protein
MNKRDKQTKELTGIKVMAAIPYIIGKPIKKAVRTFPNFFGASAIVGSALLTNGILSNLPIKSNQSLEKRVQSEEPNVGVIEQRTPAEYYKQEPNFEIPQLEYDVTDIKDYREDPGSLKIGEGSDALELTRLLVGEAEQYWNWKENDKHKEYLGHVASSVLNRAETYESTILSSILDIHKNDKSRIGYAHVYSCFNSFSDNYDKVRDPLNNGVSQKVWDSIFDFSEYILQSGPTSEVTHYTLTPQFWEDSDELVKKIDDTRFYSLNDKKRASIVASRKIGS